MPPKSNPTWIETDLTLLRDVTIESLPFIYELILNPNDFKICFFSKLVKLQAQEYKFLKAILSKNGKRISAIKLMNEIKSKCRTELKQNLSYRIKSRIENKICKAFDKNKKKNKIMFQCPDSSEVDWILLDSNKDNHILKYAGRPIIEYNNALENNERNVVKYQNVPLRKLLDMLIRVKDGKYYTFFVKGRTPYKKKYKKKAKQKEQ